MDRLLTLLGALAPVVLLIACGRGLRLAGVLTPAAGAELGRLLFWVILPARLLIECGRADLRASFDGPALIAGFTAFVAALMVGWWASRGQDPGVRGTVMTGTARANSAFVGLPVITLVAATLAPALRTELLAAFALSLAAMVITFNVGSVVAFRLPYHGVSWAGLRDSVVELPRNPIIGACVMGSLLSLWRPGAMTGTWVGTAADLLGAAAVPLALLVTGADLELSTVRRQPWLVGAIVAGKLVLVPGATWGLCHLLGAGPTATMAMTLLMACPTAVIAGAMARQLGGDDKLMAAVVVATTTLSPLTLLIWLAALM